MLTASRSNTDQLETGPRDALQSSMAGCRRAVVISWSIATVGAIALSSAYGDQSRPAPLMSGRGLFYERADNALHQVLGRPRTPCDNPRQHRTCGDARPRLACRSLRAQVLAGEMVRTASAHPPRADRARAWNSRADGGGHSRLRGAGMGPRFVDRARFGSQRTRGAWRVSRHGANEPGLF